MSVDDVVRGSAPESGDTVPPRRSAWRWVLPLLILLVVLGVAAYSLVHARAGSQEATGPVAATATDTLRVTDLTETTSYDGVLTFADARTISSKSTGTVTWLPKPGSTVQEGKRLYSVDATPTVLLYGKVPMYRALQSGVTDGTDVKQLEVALKALGHDPDGMTVDSTFDDATTAAVDDWQSSLGLTEDGVVTTSLVQFLPGPVRVQTLSAAVGDAAGVGSALYSASSASRIATVSLAAADSTVAKVGVVVKVSLPNGSSVPGRVTEVATETSASSSSSGSGTGGGGAVNQQGSSSTVSGTKVAVTVAVDDPKAVAEPDQTPVTIGFTSSSAKGVLAAPVTALVALAGGGYALEVVDASGATRLVAVTPGLYAVGGLVQVEGQGIGEGTTVVIPAAS